jgi:hypothetical protein
MTDEQIIEAIATKVMGFELYSKPGFVSLSKAGILYIFPWNPLTNPADCKQVRKKLAKRFSDWSLTFDRDWPQQPYEFMIWNISNHEHSLYDLVLGRATTEELAVAICALRSVGIEPRHDRHALIQR